MGASLCILWDLSPQGPKSLSSRQTQSSWASSLLLQPVDPRATLGFCESHAAAMESFGLRANATAAHTISRFGSGPLVCRRRCSAVMSCSSAESAIWQRDGGVRFAKAQQGCGARRSPKCGDSSRQGQSTHLVLAVTLSVSSRARSLSFGTQFRAPRAASGELKAGARVAKIRPMCR